MIEIIGTIFIICFGCLGHFIYEWSNHNKILGYFFAVNESTWEHIKLVIGPSLVWFIVEFHIYYGNENLFFAEFISIFVMCLLIPIFFYSYTYFTKKSMLIIDVVTFMLAIIIGKIIFSLLINGDYSSLILQHIGYIGILIIFIKYITSTYTPNKNFIYEDPITKKYGIDGHSHEHEHDH